MPELRKDPLSGRWVIIAPERSLRPRELREQSTVEETFCPFCPGHESASGQALLVIRGPTRGHPGASWKVRVVPNRYPALRVEGTPGGEADGLYDRMNGIGAHEVIIDTPHHEITWGRLPPEELSAVLKVYRERIRDLRRDFRLEHILIFKNEGALAGATLAHPHSQLVALPLVPEVVAQELAHSERHFQHRGRCLMCDMVGQELRDRSRLVYHCDATVAFAPYASRYPFEVCVTPRRHHSHFEAADDALLDAVGRALGEVLYRLEVELAQPAYNLVIHTSPVGTDALPHYHWHIEIMPVLFRPSAGFEIGSGYHINPTPPEVAADCLRRAQRARPQEEGGGGDS